MLLHLEVLHSVGPNVKTIMNSALKRFIVSIPAFGWQRKTTKTAWSPAI
jgi:hypothetical protein